MEGFQESSWENQMEHPGSKESQRVSRVGNRPVKLAMCPENPKRIFKRIRDPCQQFSQKSRPAWETPGGHPIEPDAFKLPGGNDCASWHWLFWFSIQVICSVYQQISGAAGDAPGPLLPAQEDAAIAEQSERRLPLPQHLRPLWR